MKTTPLVAAVVLALTGSALLVSTLKGAPFLPKERKLPDEIYSLSDLGTIHAVLDAIPPELNELKDDLEQLFHDHLEEAGLEVRNDPNLPRLALQLQASTDPNVPDGLAVAIVLALHQPVVVERLASRLVLPTVSMSWVKQTTERDAPKVVLREVRFLLNFFTDKLQEATEQWEERKEGV